VEEEEDDDDDVWKKKKKKKKMKMMMMMTCGRRRIRRRKRDGRRIVVVCCFQVKLQGHFYRPAFHLSRGSSANIEPAFLIQHARSIFALVIFRVVGR